MRCRWTLEELDLHHVFYHAGEETGEQPFHRG